MDEKSKKPNKENIFVSFFKAWIYIFEYILLGLKFVCVDIWVTFFNSLSFVVDKIYHKITHPKENKTVNINTESAKEENIEEIYQKTKISKQKKQKIYKYSKKKLEKYKKMQDALAIDLQNAGATRTKNPFTYRFIVRDKNNGGKIFSGTMTGFSKLDINSFLINEGYEVIDIKTSDLINFLYKDSQILSKKMSTKDLVFWLTQLATYLKSGITLAESVKILSMQMKKDKTRQRMFRSICYELTLGESFSNALEKQGNFFPPLLINMIKAAEATGTLQETLDDMANYYTDINNTKKEMISALTYPAIIFVFSIAVITFIIIYVVPQFSNVYSQSGVAISGITAVIISLSDFLSANLITLIFVIVLILLSVIFLYKKVKVFRMYCQILFMNIPVFKNVLIYKELTVFAKTFASLLRNNVFITESMDILSKITNNEVYKAIMFKTISNIVKGEKISEAFKDHWAVPEVAYYMIVTGESTGELAEMMQKVSDYYQAQHKAIVSSLKSFIEPVMIVFLAVMIGVIIISVIIPMFSLYNEII